ncbi:hypothetical protein [Flavobacterium algicola]|uniref:hypothetical protein n=1 Tax=Flavobacterium algicola TaxID=556529 RepID=UPI001EFDBD64|nr:hypothetical protein [Flavobacterium algicola]MCG9792475.1 hypothetical protein [Flavobacterium algicola]
MSNETDKKRIGIGRNGFAPINEEQIIEPELEFTFDSTEITFDSTTATFDENPT